MPFPDSRRPDAAILLLALLAWLGLARVQAGLSPGPGTLAMAAVGLAHVLGLCKFLTLPPLLRPGAALLPLLLATAAAPALAGTPALPVAARQALWAASLLAAGGYQLVSLWRWFGRHGAWRAGDGRLIGFDARELYRCRERWLARWWPGPARRVLFPPTDKEAVLAASFAGLRHRLEFAPLAAATVSRSEIVLPLAMCHLDELEAFRDRLPPLAIPIPSRACIALCDDKPAFNRALAAHGHGRHVPAMGPGLARPYLLKKRRDEWGTHSHVLASAEDETRFARELRDPDYFTQAYVPGRSEYTTHVLFLRGRIVRALSVEFRHAGERGVKGPATRDMPMRLCRSRHLALFAGILRDIGFEGLGCFNYKRVDGQPMIFEFNPRFGSTLGPYFFSFLRSLP